MIVHPLGNAPIEVFAFRSSLSPCVIVRHHDGTSQDIELSADEAELIGSILMREAQALRVMQRFLNEAQEGVRVRAIVQSIHDLPGEPDPGPLAAQLGDEGTVVHAQNGIFPTVRFDRTRYATCVTHLEVEVIR